MSVINLKYPVSSPEGEITRLNLRRPKIKDQLSASVRETDAEKEIALVAALCGVSENAVKELDLSDYTEVRKEISRFLSESAS